MPDILTDHVERIRPSPGPPALRWHCNSCHPRGAQSVRTFDIRDFKAKGDGITLDGGVYDNRPTAAYRDIEVHRTPVFDIRYADNIHLRDTRVTSSGKPADYFAHALEAENVTGLGLTRFSGEAAHRDGDQAIVIR